MSFPRYPSYKDSGVEWLGEVPWHWAAVPIKHLGRLKGGAGFPHDKQGVEGEELSFHKVNALAQADGDGFLADSDNTIDRSTAKELGAFVFPPDCIVFAKVGAALLLGRIRLLSRDACLDNNMMGLVVDQREFHVKFVRHAMALVRFDLIANPGAVPSLNEGQIGDFRLAIPPLEEQTQIAAFLDRETAKIDALVAEQRRLMDLLKDELDSLVLSSMSSSCTKEVRLENAATVMSRPVIQKDSELYTPIGLFNRGRGLFHKDPRGIGDMGDSDFFWIEEGDLIISGQFAWEGSVALAGPEEHNCVVSHRYPVLRGRDGVALTEYLYAFLCTKHGDFLLNENSWGAAGRNRPLNINHLLKERIPIPEMETQFKVAKAVHNRTRLAGEIARQASLLQERRTALISAAVTGQVDVRGLASADAEKAAA